VEAVHLPPIAEFQQRHAGQERSIGSVGRKNGSSAKESSGSGEVFRRARSAPQAPPERMRATVHINEFKIAKMETRQVHRVIAEDSWINVEVGEDGRYAVDVLLEMSETERGIIRQQRFRVAGTAEFNGMNRDIRDDRVKPLVDWTRMLFPDVDTNQVVPWAGLRPMMPNMMPRVGKGRQPGVFYNTGHGHLGWSLSAATAQMVAETIAGAFGTDVAIAA
jgi:hypothetical protein